MSRHAIQVTVSESDRQELERWVSAHLTPQQVAQRCRIILAAAKGQQDKDIAKSMEINLKTVALWRQRFCSEGPDCFWEVAAGRGRKPQFTADKIEEIINATLQTRPYGSHPLELSDDGRKAWRKQGNDQPDLAKSWS